ncbi:MAG: TerC/Alx family metal homeostasis membrane protein [Acidimicrobiia bacterium]|nr:TerC/Alx family metal homeostasis membrane protein [Acidimicrobiia bacterium]
MIALAYGADAFGEYLSGYLIEKSLSVDNVFVWSMLFASLSIPLKYQHRVLFWGIFGALTLRAVFILLGTALIGRLWWILLVFGAFLIFTGAKIIRHRAGEVQSEATRGLGLLRKILPVTEHLDGHRFFSKLDGRLAATPLLAALFVVEVTDIIFAVDSVPAILAVSNLPFLVFASNAFAILGLRAMYFLLANTRERFHYLSHALGGILIFVGVKMTISHWYHFFTDDLDATFDKVRDSGAEIVSEPADQFWAPATLPCVIRPAIWSALLKPETVKRTTQRKDTYENHDM